MTNDEVLVSDDARHIESGRIDEKLVHEYLCCMYTLGSDTLDPEVKQVRAGERVEVNLDTGMVSLHDEWVFTRTFNNDSPSLGDLDAALIASVSRSVEGHGGMIVVPLSGGF